MRTGFENEVERGRKRRRVSREEERMVRGKRDEGKRMECGEKSGERMDKKRRGHWAED